MRGPTSWTKIYIWRAFDNKEYGELSCFRVICWLNVTQCSICHFDIVFFGEWMPYNEKTKYRHTFLCHGKNIQLQVSHGFSNYLDCKLHWYNLILMFRQTGFQNIFAVINIPWLNTICQWFLWKQSINSHPRSSMGQEHRAKELYACIFCYDA